MPLVINDPETIAAIERLAAQSGKTQEDVVRELAVANVPSAAIEASGEAPETDEEWLARLHELTARMRACIHEPFTSADIDALLYDEHGLPK